MSNPISHILGHKIYFEYGHYKWRYFDNHESIESEKRKCLRCGQYQTINGHDQCVADSAGVLHVCCGHGVLSPYKITSSYKIKGKKCF
jgi:hypothetical protein